MQKVALITGASSGVGKATALALASKGVRLVLVARNPQKGEQLIQVILQKYPSANVRVLLADLALQSDIRALAQSFQQQYNQLDILINCAGVVSSQRMETPEGIENTFAVNYLSYFLLTNLLLHELQKAPQGRVINVASLIPPIARIRFDDLQGRKRYSPTGAYLQAKVATVMFTYELAQRLSRTHVTVNAVHPGVVKTNLGVETSTGLLQAFVRFASLFIAISPEKSAERIVFLALSPDVERLTGQYFKAGVKPVRTTAYSRNPALWKQLWAVSETFKQ